jgi:Holliday junction DNA helicase RuvA
MLAGIKGKVIFHEPGKLLLEVGPVIFEILVPLSLHPSVNSEINLFTALFIREENVVLLGFASEIEKVFFYLVLTVPGVGPKLALSIVGFMPVPDLAAMIESGSSKSLERIPGVGKKLAQRLIGDLKGKVSKFAAESLGGPESQAVEILVDLGLEQGKAWEAVKSFHSEQHSVDELVNLSLKRLGETSR